MTENHPGVEAAFEVEGEQYLDSLHHTCLKQAAKQIDSQMNVAYLKWTEQ